MEDIETLVELGMDKNIANKTKYCPLEVKLIPETTCVCAVYVRAKRETCCIGEDKAMIKSEMNEHFSLDIPKGAFEEETSLSLKVYETNTEDDMVHISENEVAKEQSVNANILTDVYQILIDGNQPKKGITLQIPMDRDLEGDDELVIAALNERSLSNEEDALEIIDVPPQIISGSLIVEISHFSIFVATWKLKVEAETDKLELQKAICDTLKKKKPASFFAVVKKVIEDDQGLKHVMIVECNVASKSQKRLDSWVEKGFAARNQMETGSFMMCPSDTNSFQPYTLTLNQGIYDPDEAYCHAIISQKKGIETEEVTRLRVKMTPPPKPPSQRTPSPIISPIPPPTTSPSPTQTIPPLPLPKPRSDTIYKRPEFLYVDY
ncbi:hypothetical protein MAR_022997 [Mya arenaria]|uniref:Uncharacterized protein n=1 Tax=Mya arenaria TaxID=6604 RepID=A0ABY7DLS4_MYAAR|nr:hypothetical protein MAR_022997 [Mya arenaria]